MGIFDRFRKNKTRTRASKYSLERIESSNELIKTLKEIIKAKDIAITGYKKALGEIIDLEEDGYTLKQENQNSLTQNADLTDIVIQTLASREDIPRPLKLAIQNYGEANRLELNSVLNSKVNEFLTPKDEKKTDTYGV